MIRDISDTTYLSDNFMAYFFSDTVLLIFCKAPIPGQVKTRLTPSLTPEQAAETHRQLATTTLQIATAQPCCPIQLWCSPNTQSNFFAYAAQTFPLSLHQQQGEDLGARMHYALAKALKNYSYAMIIGTDCPLLTPTTLQEACIALKKNDIVLAPAEDGGYVLIGCKAPQPVLFEDMPWGSDRVLPLTRERIRQQSLTAFELATHWDVDTIDDYHRWLRLEPPSAK